MFRIGGILLTSRAGTSGTTIFLVPREKGNCVVKGKEGWDDLGRDGGRRGSGEVGGRQTSACSAGSTVSRENYASSLAKFSPAYP